MDVGAAWAFEGGGGGWGRQGETIDYFLGSGFSSPLAAEGRHWGAIIGEEEKKKLSEGADVHSNP